MPPSASPTRSYRSPRREAQARATRRAVLAAATERFLAVGYAGTTMRAVAEGARVSVPTVELAFGTKAGLLKAAIDVAIAGDDEPVAVVDREWAAQARATTEVTAFLWATTEVLAPAQARSAGLMLALSEAATTDDGLRQLSEDKAAQREAMAGWLVDGLRERAPLRPGLRRRDAVDIVWLLMEPVLYHRLTGPRGWTARRYQRWFVDATLRLLTDEPPAADLECPPPIAPTRKAHP